MTHTLTAHPDPAIIYLRQSLDRTGQRLAVARQLEANQSLCAARGIPVLEVIEDNDVSASSRKRRPGFERLVGMITSGQVRTIVAYAVDRLTRTLLDLERLIDLVERYQVTVVTVSGDLDLSTPVGRAVARILASIARQEVEVKAARQQLRNKQALTDGMPLASGMRTVGYVDAALSAVIPNEVTLIQEGYAQLLAGASTSSIARLWNAQGLRTSRNGKWTASTVKIALTNPRYSGISAYRENRQTKQVMGTGRWTAIIDMDTWEAAQSILNDPARKTTTGPARKYLMSGMALCAVCGEHSVYSAHVSGKLVYRCPKLHLSRRIEQVDGYVREVVAEYLRQPGGPQLAADTSDAKALRQEAAAVRARLDRLTAMFMDDRITEAQLDRGTADARARLEAISNAQAANAGLGALAPLLAAVDPGQAFLDAPLDVQRTLVDMLVTVRLSSLGRGKGRAPFDPSTIQLDWKVSEATAVAA